MNKRTSNKILYIPAAVLILIIAAAVIFSDSITGFLGRSSETVITEPQLNVPQTPYVFNGTQEFNPLADVSAADSDGSDLTANITYTVSDGDSVSHKIIEYTVQSKTLKKITAQRELELENYSGPSIVKNLDVVNCDFSGVNHLADILLNENAVTAYDGFGNNISQDITVDKSYDVLEAGVYDFKVSVKNMLYDTAETTVSVDISGEIHENPIILTTNAATIAVGSGFSPMDYVSSAIDPEYGDLLEYVKYRTSLSTSIPGVYYVHYYIDGYDGVSSASVTLKVNVA